jgi:methyl-accepting chemotaxis protein
VEALQEAMPALEQASRAIDTTLSALADFEWNATIPIVNYQLGFGLGIEYDPPVPLDESVAQVSEALSELPTRLDGIEDDLVRTNSSLGETASSIQQVGEELKTVSRDLHATSEVLNEYDDLFARATDQVRQVRWDIRDQIFTGQAILSGLLLWLAFSQFAPLYLGCTLLFPRSREMAPPQGEHPRPPAEG